MFTLTLGGVVVGVVCGIVFAALCVAGYNCYKSLKKKEAAIDDNTSDITDLATRVTALESAKS